MPVCPAGESLHILTQSQQCHAVRPRPVPLLSSATEAQLLNSLLRRASVRVCFYGECERWEE